MQAFLIKLIVKIFETIFKSSKPTMSEGAGPGDLEKGLRAKIKKEGWE